MDLPNILEIQSFRTRHGNNNDFHILAVGIILTRERLQFE